MNDEDWITSSLGLNSEDSLDKLLSNSSDSREEYSVAFLLTLAWDWVRRSGIGVDLL